jgi:hypothetical protein
MRRRRESGEKFDVYSAVGEDLLAQHAGSLLLEYPNTQYACRDQDSKVIQGIICMETQVFTQGHNRKINVYENNLCVLFVFEPKAQCSFLYACI